MREECFRLPPGFEDRSHRILKFLSEVALYRFDLPFIGATVTFPGISSLIKPVTLSYTQNLPLPAVTKPSK